MKTLIAFCSLLFLTGLAWAHGGSDHTDQPTTSHLGFAGGALHAHVTWEAGPQVSSESRMKIEWRNGSDHSPVEPPGSFRVSLFMPSMGHGSAPTQIQRVLDAQGAPLTGVFEVSNVYFTMGGDWQVKLTLNFADGSKETQVIDLNLPSSGGGHSHSH